jgi:hypothetical protein
MIEFAPLAKVGLGWFPWITWIARHTILCSIWMGQPRCRDTSGSAARWCAPPAPPPLEGRPPDRLLDLLSNGRFIFGAGIGSGRIEEWDNFDEQTDPRLRGEMLDEGLDVLAGLWSGQPFSYAGQHYHVQGSTFTPTPVQQPRIPIWIAGVWPKKAPFRRAARWDGMCPLLPEEGDPLAHLKDAIDFTQSCRPDPAAPFDIVYITGPVSRDPALFAEQVARAAAMEQRGDREFRAPLATG